MTDRRFVSGTMALGALGAFLAFGVALPDTPTAEDVDDGQEAQVYRGSLEPIDGSGAQGEVVVQRMDEQLSVRVNASGLASGTHPQHIHANASCSDFGGVEVPLDSNLGSSGGSFPSTEGESGSLTYNQKGTSADFADLALADKTVVIHDTEGTPVGCATLEKRGK